MTIMDYVGAVGITMLISISSTSMRLTQWLAGFSNPKNPLPLIGHMISCSMLVGFMVGTVFGGVLTGGVTALFSFIADETLSLIDRAMRSKSTPQMLPQQFSRQQPSAHRPLTEGEAHSAVGVDEDDDD